MSLLSTSESMAFQSFLSSIDYSDSFHPTQAELLLYAHGSYPSSDQIDSKSRDALKKATLDLISLDSSSSSHSHPAPWISYPDRDHIPSVPKSFLRYPMRSTDHVSLSKPLLDRPLSLATDLSQNFAHSTPDAPPTPSPSSAYPSIASSSRPPLPRLTPSTKRSFDTVASPSPSSSNKRFRFSPPLSDHSSHIPSPSSASSSTPIPSVPSSRPTLLSASQKRANHIQSEQKRRANIRKGYEALCETVPALRDAIRKEEEEASAAGSSIAPNSNKGRRKKSKALADDDKMDGRAGPKSENIVLQKTIDYIQDLNSTKENLLRRLHQARHMLGSGHPALYSQDIPQDGVPLWEREWTGGLGLSGEDDEPVGSDEDGQ